MKKFNRREQNNPTTLRFLDLDQAKAAVLGNLRLPSFASPTRPGAASNEQRLDQARAARCALRQNIGAPLFVPWTEAT
jgi:hypothetical protein